MKTEKSIALAFPPQTGGDNESSAEFDELRRRSVALAGEVTQQAHYHILLEPLLHVLERTHECTNK